MDDELVVTAVKQAVQEVAARNRRRLRVESILIGIAVATAVAVPTTIVISGENARTNCHLITALAKLGTKKLAKEKAQLEDFEKKSKDRFGLTGADFTKLVARERQENQERQVVLEAIAHHSCG